MEQEFAIAFGACDGGIDNFDASTAEFLNAGADAIDGELVGCGIAHDAAFADVLAASFKLRFDEDDGFRSGRGLRTTANSLEQGREKESCGDEGDIDGNERNAGWEIVGVQVARIGALHQRDARVVTEGLGDLAVAGVDGEDAGGAVLEHAVGEAAGGGPDIEAEAVAEVDGPMSESGFELEAAAADVAEAAAEEPDVGVIEDRGAGFIELLLVNEDATGEDEGLGSLAGGGEMALH